MNNLKFTYGELLKIIVENIDKYYFQYDYFTVEYGEYKISYDVRDSVLTYRFKNSKKVINSFCYFFEYKDDEFFYISDKCQTIPVPQTKEEWFLFAIENEQTKEDFDNLIKIHNYVKRNGNFSGL